MSYVEISPPETPSARRTSAGSTLVPADIAELVSALPHLEHQNDVLEHAVSGAARLVAGARHVTISVADHQSLRTIVATSPAARQIDEAQYAAGAGPCLSAVAQGSLVLDDETAARRWPHLQPAFAAAGVSGALSLPLIAPDGTFGALSLFAASGSRFGSRDVVGAEVWATVVALALVPHQRASQWKQALDSRDVIGQAKGILMERFLIPADSAFDMLVEASQTRNRKLRDIARSITETGLDPTKGYARRP